MARFFFKISGDVVGVDARNSQVWIEFHKSADGRHDLAVPTVIRTRNLRLGTVWGSSQPLGEKIVGQVQKMGPEKPVTFFLICRIDSESGTR